MEIRALRPEEMDEMIALQCLVFRPDGHQRYTQYICGDSSYQFDQTRVGLQDGRIVSTLRIWDRQLRVGTCPVRMGGIGGVGTHPDFRGAGRGSALMRDTARYLRRAGYHIGLLFSEIPCRFYRRVGWASWPLAGFRLQIRHITRGQTTDWQVAPFSESRDLDAAAGLYAVHNARQSGSIVRPRAYWDAAPARIRDLLPTVVARRGDAFGGYLNFQLKGRHAHVLEVAYDRRQPSALAALTDHLLQVCAQNHIETIDGDIPHRHPLVERLSVGADGDLHLTGPPGPMLYLADLPGLLQQVLPDLQARLNARAHRCAPCIVQLIVDDCQCFLHLRDNGELRLGEAAPDAIPLPLPTALFWRLLCGESSWRQLLPFLGALDLEVGDDISTLLAILFPAQDVIFWAPDHF